MDPAAAYPYAVRRTVNLALFSGKGEVVTPLLHNALADLSRAIELDPSLALALFMRALVYEELKQYDAAIDDSSRAIELYANVTSDPYMALLYGHTGADHKKDLAQLYYLRGFSKWRRIMKPSSALTRPRR
jgi:tetratricopeptide (TPR) repeat protein